MTATSQSDSNDQIDSIVRTTIGRALEQLKDANPAAHAILVSRCSEYFFEQPQSKRTIRLLADQLLKTTLVEGDRNAD